MAGPEAETLRDAARQALRPSVQRLFPLAKVDDIEARSAALEGEAWTADFCAQSQRPRSLVASENAETVLRARLWV